MIKFKQQNIIKLANDNNINYCLLDVLRQTTIKRLTDQANKQQLNKQQLKNIILTNINNLLDMMILEDSNHD